jgi:hypothetical protein
MPENPILDEPTAQARDVRALHLADPMLSVRLLRIAFVHLTLRRQEAPPRTLLDDELPDALPMEEFRFGVTRHIATWLGRPKDCGLKECRRKHRCCGHPPDCWRAEPPPTPLELELAKGLMRYHLDRALLERIGENYAER